MTEEQILKLVKKYFNEGGIRDDGSCSEYYGDPDAFVKFSKEIHRRTRRNTLHEIISRLSSAPNAEVNQYAIILTEKQLFSNDDKIKVLQDEEGDMEKIEELVKKVVAENYKNV